MPQAVLCKGTEDCGAGEGELQVPELEERSSTGRGQVPKGRTVFFSVCCPAPGQPGHGGGEVVGPGAVKGQREELGGDCMCVSPLPVPGEEGGFIRDPSSREGRDAPPKGAGM